MAKKVLLGVGVLAVVLVGALFLWARAILASDGVRTAVESQLTRALGQPVRIGSMGATVVPRVTMTLHDVRIGEPARITALRLHVGTDLGALVSRRIEHGSVRLDGARIELPLPASFASPAEASDGDAAGAPVEIVSIDEISLSAVEIVSGGRTLRGDVDMAVAGPSVTIRRAVFEADGTSLSLTGRIDDTSGPTGELAIQAPALDVVSLLAFVSDFAAGGIATAGGAAAGRAPSAADPTPMNLTASLEVGRATFGRLALEGFSGRARVTPDRATLDPIAFGVFDGRYEGTLALSLADVPAFRLNASLDGVDLAALTAFAGHPELVTGRLTGRLDVSGSGTTPDRVIESTAGTARVDAVDGSVKGLGLVRAVVLATSMRGDSRAAMGDTATSEPFSRLGATLSLGGASASTKDLRFESKDLLVDAAGTFRLDGTDIDLTGRVQLSDELSQQAGRDLARYTADEGRVTLPAAIGGSADDLQVRIDTAALLKRAITNRANEEVKDAIKKGLGGLLGR